MAGDHFPWKNALLGGGLNIWKSRISPFRNKDSKSQCHCNGKWDDEKISQESISYTQLQHDLKDKKNAVQDSYMDKVVYGNQQANPQS